MSGKRGASIDTSLFTKPPPNFKVPSTSAAWSNSSTSSKKLKQEEPPIHNKHSSTVRSLMKDGLSSIQHNHNKNDPAARLSQTTPQYVLTATQSFMMTPMSNVQVVQQPPPSLPIQNPPVAVDPSYYAFYYDPKSGYNSTAFAAATPVSYSPSSEPFALPHSQYPPPLPSVPPPQNPPPPPLPSTSSNPPYRSAYSPSSQYSSNPRQYPSNTPQYSTNTPQFCQTTPQYSPTTPQYSPTTSQYSSSNSKPAYYRRTNEPEDQYKKNMRKRKKPLSQNIPQRKDWSVGEARRALEVEKDCNKRNKRQSLIIKFPDLELNRLIVANFHESIDSVHFQQPSTPRFCFVTLQDSADPETVIEQLNRIPFGQGFLTAEFKKDREDEMNIGPEDIDPLTLYVGNLAQDVTKEDMVRAYPKQKRIDIGYAKKMKYTRYAFVSFKTVDDSIEAFQRTHATQMYSKSLIVRFRRLHGTVGMPGEPKPPPHHRTDSESSSFHPADEKEPDQDPVTAPWDIDISRWDEEDSPIKLEQATCHSEDEVDTKPVVVPLKTRFMPGSADVAFALHKPRVVQVKPERNAEDNGQVATKQEYDGQFPQNSDTSQDMPMPIIQKVTLQSRPAGNGRLDTEAVMKREDENVSFPMPISVKKEILDNSTDTKQIADGPAQDSPSNSMDDEKYIRKMFTPISVKMEPDDSKNMDLGISALQNECSNLTSNPGGTSGSEDRSSRAQGTVETENGATSLDTVYAFNGEKVNEGSESVEQSNPSQDIQNQGASFEFGDWINVAPTVKDEPAEEDDMNEGVDSSGDEEFSFSHIMKTRAKKRKKISRSIV